MANKMHHLTIEGTSPRSEGKEGGHIARVVVGDGDGNHRDSSSSCVGRDISYIIQRQRQGRVLALQRMRGDLILVGH